MLLSDIFVRSEVKYSNYLPGSSFRRSKSVGAKIIIVSQMRVKNRRQPSTAGARTCKSRQGLMRFWRQAFYLALQIGPQFSGCSLKI